MIETYGMTTWKRIKYGLRECKPSLSLRLCLFNTGYHFDLFGYLIVLPFMDRWYREPKDLMESWGVYLYEWTELCFDWGPERHKRFYMPWMLQHFEHKVMLPDGSWTEFVGSWERDKEPDGRWTATYPYRYTLKNGTVQERTATIHVERRIWRRRWLMWTSFGQQATKAIDVEFNDEVGERTGSWKGGTIGCGYEMKPCETPEQTLRRMERERVFN